MSLGFAIGNNGGGDFLPIVKYDARAGRTFRVDRVGTETTTTEIAFKAIIDMENIEVGWMHFSAGTAPSLVLYPLGSEWGAQPSSDHKRGVRAVVKLAKEAGGDVREMASSSQAFLRAFDHLHSDYEDLIKHNVDGQRGKLPVVKISKTVPITSKGGGQSSTNYEPVFEITGWVDRPADLKPNLRGGSAPAVKAAPATGATRVSAPAPVMAMSDAEVDEF